MYRMRCVCLTLGLLVAIVLGSRSSDAQYTANFQTNIISGVTSNWSGYYIVGSNTFADVLLIQNSGALTNWDIYPTPGGYGFLGYEVGSSNNSAVVAGPGSVWSNHYDLTIGNSGAFNSLVISNGGSVYQHGDGHLGYNLSSSNNNVVVSITGSLWAIDGFLDIGHSGGGNSLVINEGGRVSSTLGRVGVNSSSNSVLVVGTGSVWSNGFSLRVGDSGPGNSLVIRNGGRVFAGRAASPGGGPGESYVGFGSSNNNVVVTGTGSLWATDDTGLYIGRSGGGNSLVINEGGRVSSTLGYLGYNSSSSNNSVLVAGTGSVWSNSGPLSVGNSGVSNSLVISEGGTIYCQNGYIGSNTTAMGNSVVVTGTGSIWSNLSVLTVGYSGAGNSLVISNSGKVINNSGIIGFSSRSNSVLVTGTGSVWNCGLSLFIGGSSNSLIISNGGQVINTTTSIGGPTGSSGNSVVVTDGGTWQNMSLIIVSHSNSVVVQSGSLCATNIIIGRNDLCDNLLQLDCGSVIVTNAAGDATLEVRRGKLVLNSGTLQVDRFVMTNACAQFVRTGGTLVYGVAVLDPNRDDDGDGIPNGYEQSHGLDPLNAADANVDSDGDGFTNLQEFLAGTDATNSASFFGITAIAKETDDIRVTWMTGPGKTNALERSAGTGNGSYSNNFAAIFTVTNTVTTATNYLDAGAFTNFPSRFYRVRLVP